MNNVKFNQSSTNDYVSNGMFTFGETTTTNPNTKWETTRTKDNFITDWVVTQTEPTQFTEQTNTMG